jgi:ATP-dependent DNA ligase
MPLLGKENQRMMLDLASKDIVAKLKDSVYKPVAQIEFTEWTPDGHLRHSRFVGLREDKEAREVVREG